MTDLSAIAVQTGETISLLLISFSFVILSYLSIRAKSLRSLQFQMFVVVLTLMIAEVPRILQTLGILTASSFADLVGLVIHTISMIFLSAFLLYRVRSLTLSSKDRSKKSDDSKEKMTGIEISGFSEEHSPN